MKQVVNTLIQRLISLIFQVIGLFPKAKLVYFESFHGKQCSDNPKAVADYLLKHDPEYQVIWGASSGYEATFKAQGVSYVRRFSWQWFLTMPRAQAWVINTRTPLYLKKSKHTTYIQTWHGTPLKKIGLDIPDVHIPGYDNESYRLEIKAESARWDYLISPNPYCSQILPQAFGYCGPLLEQGYPRNDLLVQRHGDQAFVEQLKIKLGIAKNKRVILYAPTWRESHTLKEGGYDFELLLDFKKLAETIGSDVVLLVRMHYLVSQSIDFAEYGETVQDVSQYPEMSELLLVADLLITDYSSSFIDFMLTRRPIIFFLYDRVAYEEQLRGLYVSVETSFPGEIVTTQEALFTALRTYLAQPNQMIAGHHQQLYADYSQLEKGHAAQHVVDLIKESTRKIK